MNTEDTTFLIALLITAATLIVDVVIGNPLRYYDTAIYVVGLASLWDYRSMTITGKVWMVKYGSGARRRVDKDRNNVEFEKMRASRYIGGFAIMAVALALESYGFYAK